MQDIMDQGYYLCTGCKKSGKRLADCPRCTPFEYGWNGKWTTLAMRDKYLTRGRLYDDRQLTIRKPSGETLGTFSMPTPTHSYQSARPFVEAAQANGPAMPDELKYQWIRQNTLRYNRNKFGSAL